MKCIKDHPHIPTSRPYYASYRVEMQLQICICIPAQLIDLLDNKAWIAQHILDIAPIEESRLADLGVTRTTHFYVAIQT